MDLPNLVRFKVAAKMYRVSPRTIYDWVAAGHLAAVTIDTRRFIDLSKSPPPPPPTCVSIRDAALLLGISRQSVYARIAAGRYRTFEHCGRRLVCITASN
jgi:hypothetical protein